MKRIFLSAFSIICISCVLSFSSVTCFADENTVRIYGTVEDFYGTRIPGATITFISEGDTVTVFSANNGSYEIYLSSVSTGIDEQSIPHEFELLQNYPNPFNPSTTIEYVLIESVDVRLDIFNISGQHILTLRDGYESIGIHTIRWDGLDERGKAAATGVYFYRLRAGEFSETKKMLLLDGGGNVKSLSGSYDLPEIVGKVAKTTQRSYDIVVEKRGFETYRKYDFLVPDGESEKPAFFYLHIVFEPLELLFNSLHFEGKFFAVGDTVEIALVADVTENLPETAEAIITSGLGDSETVVLNYKSYERITYRRWYFETNLRGYIPSSGSSTANPGNGILEVDVQADSISITPVSSAVSVLESTLPIENIRTEIIPYEVPGKWLSLEKWQGLWFAQYIPSEKNSGSWYYTDPSKISVEFKSTTTEVEIDSLNAEYGVVIFRISPWELHELIVPEEFDPVDLILLYIESDLVNYAIPIVWTYVL